MTASPPKQKSGMDGAFIAAYESVGISLGKNAYPKRLNSMLSEFLKRNVKAESCVGDLDDLAWSDGVVGHEAEIVQNQYANVQRLPVALQKLTKILSKPEWRSLLTLHDTVASGNYLPRLPAIPHEVDEDDGIAVKIVRLVRNNEPLGATIKCEENGAVLVARIMKGGVADRSGCIQVGDRVLEVNGVSVTGKKPSDIVKLLVGDEQTVTFKLVPTDDDSDVENESVQGESSHSSSQRHTSRQQQSQQNPSNIRVRALFSYDAKLDPLHPCPEAGLNFAMGDVLEVVDDSDKNWWQVRLEKQGVLCRPTNCGSVRRSDFGRVALVPSNHLQMRRNQTSSQHGVAQRHRTNQAGGCSPKSPICGTLLTDSEKRRDRSQLQKVMYTANSADDLMGADENAKNCYETVTLLYPRANLLRPLVLLGAPGVGRNELQRRLLMTDADKFATTVPHTSRAPRRGETDGVEYNFATRAQMEEWIRAGRFLEHGEYKGNLYGTLVDSVVDLVRTGRTPVLAPHPHALRVLRNAQIKPYVVFVKPPPFPALKETRSSSHATRNYARTFTDDELKAMIQAAELMHATYGQWFDYELVNGALEFAFRELCDVVQRLEKEPQWVPLGWVA